MAVPAQVSTFVKAGMNNVWRSCNDTRRISRNDMQVIFKFVMSLIVTIVFASITANVLYICDYDSFFAKQDHHFLVSELHVSDKTETSVRLKWTKPVLKATRYEVQVSSEMSDSLEVDAWMEDNIDIDMLTSGVQYSFSVTSFVKSDELDDKQEIPFTSETISIITKPAIPGPVDMDNSRVFQTHVKLSWGASLGNLDSYSVVLKNCMGDVVAETTTESTYVTLPLGNPSTFIAYVAEISAMSGGERSEAQTQVIQVEESDLCIQDLSISTDDTVSATLEWEHPAYQPVKHYEVRWSPPRSDQLDTITVDPGQTGVSIGGLTPGQQYKFSVTSVLPTQCGEEKHVHSQVTSVTTRPAVPGSVDRIKSTIKSTSLKLYWKVSEGLVDAYIVKIAGDSSFRAEYRTNDPFLLIENLEINTLYQLDIYAVSGNIRSEHQTEVLKTKDIQVYWGCMTKAILTGGVAVAGVALFAPVLGGIGFGAAGIGKGTLAASWMSTYGGSVASGGLFSTLQSLGVVGLGATAKAAIIASGMALGCITEVA